MKKFKGFLYHITRYKKLSVGDELDFGNEYNYFAQSIFEKSFEVGEIDINQLALTKSFNEFLPEEEKETKNYIYESCLMLRELILEDVRNKEFKKYPSRLKCLYCSIDYETAKNWVGAIKRMKPNEPPLQIVKLKVNGRIFQGDGNLMLRNTYSLNSKIEMAKKYWSGTSNELPEILFEGKAKVIEIMEEVK